MSGTNPIQITVSAETAAAVNNLGALVGELQHGLEHLSRAGEFLEGIGAKIAAFFSIESIVHFTEKAIDAEVQLGRLHEKTGISIEDIDALKKAGAAAGLGFEEVDLGLGLFADRVFMAAKHGGQLADVFRDLKISITNTHGELIPTTEILDALMNKFKTMPDGPAKTAAAMELFGRSGRQWIPMLNQGAEGLRKIKEQNGGLTEEDVERAHEFHLATQQLTISLNNLFREFANNILPTLLQFSTALQTAQKESGWASGAAQTLTDVFRGLAAAVLIIKTAFQSAGEVTGNYWAIVSEIVQISANFIIGRFHDLGDVISGVTQFYSDFAAAVANTGQVIKAVAAGDFQKAADIAKANAKLLADDIGDIGEGYKTLFNNVKTYLPATYNNIWSTVKKISSSTVTDITAQWQALVPTLNNLFNPQTKRPEKANAKKEPGASPITNDEEKKLILEIDKMYAESTKGKIALLDIEEAALKKKIDEEFHDTEKAEAEKTKVTAIYAKKRADILEAFADEQSKLELQKNKNQQSEIENDSDMAQIDKKKLLLPLLQQELAFIDEKRNQQMAIYDGLEATKEQEQNAEKKLVELDGQRVQALQKIKQLNSDNFISTLRQGINQLKDDWGNFGKNLATGALDNIKNAVNSISDGITNLIMGTKTWGQALQEIGTSILTQMIRSIVQVGLQWVMNMILQATVGKALMAAQVAASVPFAAALSEVWATPATLATIGTDGEAAFAAPEQILAAIGEVALGSLGGAAEGGLITGAGGPKDDSILTWLSNGEFVIPANRVKQFGVGFFENIRQGAVTARDLHSNLRAGLSRPITSSPDAASQLPGLSGRGTGSSGPITVHGHKAKFVVLNEKRQLAREFENLEPGEKVRVLNWLKNNRGDFGVP